MAGVQEYEKRLLKKEHEVKEARAEVQELRAQLDSARVELADASRMLPAPEPTPGATRPVQAALSIT
jgi:multidrug resistance efflux pump